MSEAALKGPYIRQPSWLMTNDHRACGRIWAVDDRAVSLRKIEALTKEEAEKILAALSTTTGMGMGG